MLFLPNAIGVDHDLALNKKSVLNFRAVLGKHGCLDTVI